MSIAVRGLDYLELLRVSWLIAWRYLALTLVFTAVGVPVLSLGLTGILTTLGVPREVVLASTQVIAALAPPLLFYPLIIQMMLGKSFRGFEIQTIDKDGEPHDLSLTQSVIPGLGFAVAGFLASLPYVLVMQLAAGPLGLDTWVQFTAAALWSLLVVYPIVLKILMQVNFGSFKFSVLRAA